MIITAPQKRKTSVKSIIKNNSTWEDFHLTLQYQHPQWFEVRQSEIPGIPPGNKGLFLIELLRRET